MSVATMKTPGVYVRELDAFGNSVVPVPTAIPAFIGYTGKTSFNGKNLVQQAKRINSLADFNAIFGSKPPEVTFNVTQVDPAANPKEVPNFSIGENGYLVTTQSVNYRLYSAVKFFYENGGGTCYIVSVGGYDYEKTALDDTDPFTDALELLKMEEEPTMIVIPDAVELKDSKGTELADMYKLCYALQGQMINHCGELTSRIALLDVPGGYNEPRDNPTRSIKAFRSVGGTTAKFNSYAAAYYPWLLTTVNQLGDVSNANISAASQDLVQKILQAEFPPIEGEDGVPASENPFKKYIGDLFAEGGGVTTTSSTTSATTPKAKSAGNTKIIDAIITKLKASGDPNKDPLKTALKNAEDAKATIASSDDGAQKALNSAWITVADTTVDEIVTAVGKLKPGAGKPVPAKVTLAIADATAAKGITGDAVKTAKATVSKAADVSTAAVASKTALQHVITSAQAAGTKEDLIEKWTSLANIPIMGASAASTSVSSASDETKKEIEIRAAKADTVLKNLSTSYKMLMNSMLDELNLMTPSAAMAGIYTIVDNTEGVWVAPANVAMQSVVAPAVKIDHRAQEDLNVPLDGKSVCAIRSFPGHGVLVWGARTMDGNSNDWRYINVRRTLIFIEQSVKEAARAYVFAPNDASTWVAVKSMISNFLLGLWNQGGLVGTKPVDAFSVSVGLGSTMTGEDILEGKMIVAVKVAVSHPAEFIDITFQQQMQK